MEVEKGVRLLGVVKHPHLGERLPLERKHVARRNIVNVLSYVTVMRPKIIESFKGPYGKNNFLLKVYLYFIV
jgi:hypothetical protein